MYYETQRVFRGMQHIFITFDLGARGRRLQRVGPDLNFKSGMNLGVFPEG